MHMAGDSPRTPDRFAGRHNPSVARAPLTLDDDVSESDDGNGSGIDESLAAAASSLDISAECITAPSSWSPASPCGGSSSRPRRKSKRRSISDLSPSSRMTPKELEGRGLGIPWQRTSGLCKIDINQGEVQDNAREFCLVQTPELCKRASTSPPLSPDVHSPGELQRRFINNVRRASVGSPHSGSAMRWTPSPVLPRPELLDSSDLPFLPQEAMVPSLPGTGSASRTNLKVQQQILKARRSPTTQTGSVQQRYPWPPPKNLCSEDKENTGLNIT